MTNGTTTKPGMTVRTQISLSLRLLIHPIKVFNEIKYENQGRLSASMTIVGLVILTYIFQRQLTSFVFMNPLLDVRELNVLMTVFSVLVPFILFCAANWALTSLMDGEGTFRQIMMFTGYALVPIVVINVPLIPISWMLVGDEGGFYYFLIRLAPAWMLLLVVLGTMTVHQYTVRKTILTLILVIVGMGLIAFIVLLFFTLLQQMLAFVNSVYKEIIFRL
jgi:hypothetical protein